MTRPTHPVHSLATQPTPLQTSHDWGLAAQPETSSLAQWAGLGWDVSDTFQGFAAGAKTASRCGQGEGKREEGGWMLCVDGV
jgi:hypothetical protein